MRHTLRVSLLVLLLLGVSVSLTPRPAHADNAVPRFEESKCKFDLPKGRTVNCGYLIVPEDRTNPSSKPIRIAVAIFKSKNKAPSTDAVIYLEGGPGGHSLENAKVSFSNVFAGFAEKRDFIMFDQRGVGFSDPALDCPEETKAVYDGITQRKSPDDRLAMREQAIQACHDRLAAKGINLSAYNSHENAADVNDLRTVLGYKTFNLYGISYGTRLALTIMRDFPQGIRSVLLDSSVPLQVDLYAEIPANADRAFNVFFQGCLRNRLCNAAYPNLDKVFYDLVAKLNRTPVTISVKQPYTGKKFDLVIDGDLMITMLFNALYSAESIIYLPKIISEAAAGNYKLLQEAMGGSLVQQDFISAGMYYSVQCSEEIAFSTKTGLEDADKHFPKLGKAFAVERYLDTCKIWNVTAAAAIENQPVVLTNKSAKIPTLVLEGAYDPITPPRYGSLIAQNIAGSYQFQFPGVGHGVSVGDVCPFKVAIAFFDNPGVKPEIGCISVMSEPEFITK